MHKPRGTVPVHDFMLEAKKMRDAGLTRAQVAAHFKVSVASVSKWMQRLEEAQADARNRSA